MALMSFRLSALCLLPSLVLGWTYSPNVTYSYGFGDSAGPAGSVVNISYTYVGSNAGPSGIPGSVNMSPISRGDGSSMTGDVNVYLLYYGSQQPGFDYFSQNSNRARRVIEDFINSLPSTSYYNVARKYGIGNIRVAKTVYLECTDGPAGAGKNAFSFGCDVSTKGIAALIYKQMYVVPRSVKPGWDPISLYGYGLPKDPNGIYLVVGGPETTEAFENTGGGAHAGSEYCGYHGTFVASTFNSADADANVFKYGYVQIPNQFAVNVASIMKSLSSGIKPASKCFFGRNEQASPNDDLQTDQAIALISHELIEILVSPFPRKAWSDVNGNEVMDKCDNWFSNLQSAVNPNGMLYDWNVQAGNRKFLLSPVWDPSLQSCSIGNQDNVQVKNVRIFSPQKPNYCLNFAYGADATMSDATCSTFTYTQDSAFAIGNQCLDVKGSSTVSGTPVIGWDCTGQPNQKFDYNPQDSTLRSRMNPNLCLDVKSWDKTAREWRPLNGVRVQ